jgi:hypothetical protein
VTKSFPAARAGAFHAAPGSSVSPVGPDGAPAAKGVRVTGSGSSLAVLASQQVKIDGVSEYQIGARLHIVNGYLLRETSGGGCFVMVTEGVPLEPCVPGR